MRAGGRRAVLSCREDGAARRRRPRRGASAATGPPWRPAWEGCAGRGLRSRRVRSAGPEAASPRSRSPSGGHAGRVPGGAASRTHGRVGRAGGRAGCSRRAEGRSTAAAFRRPVSGAGRGGWPRGGDMLTFRDNSWYQSGNSDVVRDRQTDRPRERASGHGASSRGRRPRRPLPSPPRLHDSLDGSTRGGRRAGGEVALVATVKAVLGEGLCV